MANLNIICCPYCGKKYFPSEIYIPKNFLGDAFYINDDLYLGDTMDLNETYTCDACKCIFKVYAEVKFKSEKTIIRTI